MLILKYNNTEPCLNQIFFSSDYNHYFNKKKTFCSTFCSTLPFNSKSMYYASSQQCCMQLELHLKSQNHFFFFTGFSAYCPK